MNLIFSKDGTDHVIRGHSDMMKALGIDYGGQLVIMTDENGELVGTGFGSEKLLKSMPVVESLRDGSLFKSMKENNEPLHKYRVKKQPLAKSESSFGPLLRELEQLGWDMRA